ncbi:MAG TPA: EcsC family protein [Acidobacteriaceae bacterium]|nr:EcsC family protein [Acidobacteriaceae bacterium]
MEQNDLKMLADAVVRLEQQSFAMTLATMVGMPIEAFMKMLPAGAQTSVANAVNKALDQCLKVAVRTMKNETATAPHNTAHRLMTGATGAAGGFFGIAGLAVELPVTTTLMLHSIAEIARSHGEDLSDPANALACLEVLAFGPNAGNTEALESAYYATRAALAQATREAAAYLAERGLTRKGAPVILQFLTKIASRFGIEVTEKAAAQMIPVAGAVGGMTANLLFTSHFQRLAEGHFAVRRLERIYGTETVREEYERLRMALPAESRQRHGADRVRRA